MATNILKSKAEHSRHYGDFRGVDFSSDHTQVNEKRLAYAVNMYKDYQSGQGQALETIVGYRRRVETPEGKEVYGIHKFVHKGEDGRTETKMLIHSGDKLYLWHNYPATIGVKLKENITLPKAVDKIQTMNIFEVTLGEHVADVVGVTTMRNEDLTNTCTYDKEARVLTVRSSVVADEDSVVITYIEGSFEGKGALFSNMKESRSTSFVFNNRLYIIDGKNYLVYDGEKVSNVTDEAYVPTTYINIIPSGENADNGTEYEQRNILSPYFKHTFIADGVTKEFYMNDNELEEITEVKVYDSVISASEYTVDLLGGKITFKSAPKKPEEAVQIKGDQEDVMYPEFHAGIEITAKKPIKAISGIVEDAVEIENIITACSIAVTYDNRVFLSGNPKYPNHLFYCGRNGTGYVDATYFGILNYVQDGVGMSPITGMIPVADTLMVLKADTQQDGSVYFHTPTESGNDINPIVYPSTQGLAGTGCLGACTNFLDDPVFVSRFGLEAVGQLSVRYERAIEHRSSLVDAKLANLDLTKATVEEWNGYLLVSIDGKVFMADSRQRYTDNTGTMQYEWYYLEDIGIYEGQYPEYKYTKEEYEYLEGMTVKAFVEGEERDIPLVVAKSVLNADNGKIEDLRGLTANEPNAEGKESGEIFSTVLSIRIEDDEAEGGYYNIEHLVYYKVHQIYDFITDKVLGYEALICDEGKGAYTGGIFRSAKIFKSVSENLYFGTENGIVCSFNFDKRDTSGEIAPKWYSFDNRAILCGCATKMDNCGIPHLTKTTIKKSTVIKTKALKDSAAKVKVRTNKKVYSQIARINSGIFSFEDMDFTDFTFNTEGQTLFAVREKEKKWVEKQYYIYSDEMQKPFALYYISFRYKIAGRYKE